MTWRTRRRLTRRLRRAYADRERALKLWNTNKYREANQRIHDLIDAWCAEDTRE